MRDMWPASGISTKRELGIASAIARISPGGEIASCCPQITRVGTLMRIVGRWRAISKLGSDAC